MEGEASWATATSGTGCCPRRSRCGRGSEKPAQMDKEGMLRLLAELSEKSSRFSVAAGPSPRVGAAAEAAEDEAGVG